MDRNPAVTVEDDQGWLHPVQLGPETLRRVALAPATLSAVCRVLERLVSDAHVDSTRGYYALGRERFGSAWAYLDLLTVLHAAARLGRPRRYLEIGVLRGRSLAVVASAAPEAAVFGFDLWIPDYAGLANTGPALVAEQLRRVGYRGALHLTTGSSRETVPAFLAEHPDLCFDLVTVDGDHSEAAARCDLETVLPRVAMGGVLVLDDLRHPKYPWLERVWDETVAAQPAFAAAKYTEVGHGVGFAVRRARACLEVESLHGSAARLSRLARLLEEECAARDERLEACEADRAARLDVIRRQGDELGRLTAQCNGLRAALRAVTVTVAIALGWACASYWMLRWPPLYGGPSGATALGFAVAATGGALSRIWSRRAVPVLFGAGAGASVGSAWALAFEPGAVPLVPWVVFCAAWGLASLALHVWKRSRARSGVVATLGVKNSPPGVPAARK